MRLALLMLALASTDDRAIEEASRRAARAADRKTARACWRLMRGLGIAAALTACGPRFPLYVMPAPDAFRPTERLVAALEATPGGAGLVTIGTDPPRTVWIYAACGSHIEHEITIGPCGPYDVDRMAVILAHEFGHALGLVDTTDEQRIMYERAADRLDAWTVEDAAAALVAELR